MDWTAIGAIGELIGAVAVVASLIYVGRQVRHASLVASVEGIDQMKAKATDFALTIAADAQLAELVVQAQVHGTRRDDLDNAERARLGYIYFAALTMQQGLWERERAGLISRHVRDEQLQRGAELLAAPYFQDVWPFMRGSFPPQYCAFIESTYLADHSGQSSLTEPEPSIPEQGSSGT